MSNLKSKIICTLYSVLCTLGLYANSPYISRVWEYCPAPGQFTNKLPLYETGDTKEDMRFKAEERIAENAQGMISLGAWGGYVVFSFDHPIANVKGQKDFVVEGNAFYSDVEIGAASGGSSEPGIVMVSYDANGNSKPDDEWYEIAGSEYTNPRTKHGYSVTYYRTEKHEDVLWKDNANQSGYIVANNFNKQCYYPLWEGETLTFSGALLPNNYEWTGTKYLLYAFEYGYADNHPNTETAAQLDISWAVKADGTPAQLDAIHFVKVYSAMQQQLGDLGETSTEIIGARDLHPNAPLGLESIQNSAFSIQKRIHNGQLVIIRDNKIYNPLGIFINNY